MYSGSGPANLESERINDYWTNEKLAGVQQVRNTGSVNILLHLNTINVIRAVWSVF